MDLKMKLILPILCFFMLSCKVDESDIQNATWTIYTKNSNDFGNAISFNKMVLKNDSIFLNNEPIYEILEYRNRYFTDEFITIKNLKTQNSATYIKK